MTNRASLRRHVALLCICALVFSLAPGVAFAKDKTALDWGNVMRLRDGSTISVTLFNGQMYRGKVVGLVKADTLPLKTKAGSMAIPKGDIKTIMTYRATFANPGLYMAVGGAVLGSTAGLTGTLQDVNSLNNGSLKSHQHVGLEIAGIAVAAAGIGVFVLAGKPRTIYEGKQVAANPTK
ncbi:MAG: hypothetical protein ACLQOO_13135 [Terriglobia bacterium]